MIQIITETKPGMHHHMIDWAAANGIDAKTIGFPIIVDTEKRTIAAFAYEYAEGEDFPTLLAGNKTWPMLVDPPIKAVEVLAYDHKRVGKVAKRVMYLRRNEINANRSKWARIRAAFARLTVSAAH